MLKFLFFLKDEAELIFRVIEVLFSGISVLLSIKGVKEKSVRTVVIGILLLLFVVVSVGTIHVIFRNYSRIPSVEGMTYIEAKEILEREGFRTATGQNNFFENTIVFITEPSGGEIKQKGTSVYLELQETADLSEVTESHICICEQETPSSKCITAVGSKIVEPKGKSYLDEHKVRFVKSEKGHSVLAFVDYTGEHSNVSFTVLEKEKVVVIAEEGACSCVVVNSLNRAGWIPTMYLVETYE